MAVETPDELAAMLSAEEFGITATLEAPGGSTASVVGVFDADYAAADPDTGADLSSVEPRFLGRTIDLAAAGEGYALIAAGVRYAVWDNRPDGTGLSELLLHRE